MMRNVAVYCASADGVDPYYLAAAVELGDALAARKIGVVYGGARVGLMRAVADAALSAGGRAVGVIPEVLMGLEVAHQDLRSSMLSTRCTRARRSDGGAGRCVHCAARRLRHPGGAI